MIPPKEIAVEANALLREQEEIKKEFKRIYRNPAQAMFAFTQLTQSQSDQGSMMQDGPDLSKVPASLKAKAAALPEKKEALNKKILNGGSFSDLVINASKKLAASGTRIDRFVASAHSDGVSLFGETGLDIQAEDYAKIKAEAPNAFSDPRHVLLMGCYTGTPMAKSHWQNLFSNSTMVTGFGTQAPSRNFPASWKLISEVLGAADELDKKTAQRDKPVSKEEVAAAQQKLEFLRMTSASVSYCGHEVSAQPKPKKSCEEEWTEFRRDMSQVENIYLSPNPAQEPPREGERSSLREAYTKLQQLCATQDKTLLEMRSMYRTRILRLLFWWKVQANFQRGNAAEIQDIRKEAESFGVKVHMPDLAGQVKRKDFFLNIQKTTKEYVEAKKAAEAKGDNALAEKIAASQQKFFELYSPLMFLDNEQKIPATWVE